MLNGVNAERVVVSARTTGASRDPLGVSLFVVERDAPGFEAFGYRTNDDHEAADVSLNEVELPAQALLGELGQALPVIEDVLDAATVALAAEGLGAMDQVMEITSEYLKTREQFGRAIGKNQALQFRMVEMFYALEESRSMLQWAATTLGGEISARRSAVSAMKVKLGTSTFPLMFRQFMAIISASVPLPHATACFTPINFANPSSNAAPYLPRVS